MQSVLAPTASPARRQVASLVHSLLDEVVADQDEYWGGGLISPSAYETAWVAMVRDPHDPYALAFPDALTWLLKQQRRDGSWGFVAPYTILPTMAAVLALSKAPRQNRAVVQAAASGERYLRRAFLSWSAASFDTPFFEFLLPVLATELGELGIRLPVPHLDMMLTRSSDKLQRVPLHLLYSGSSNLIHAVEAFGSLLDYRRLRSVRAPDGSYGCSPSATAAVLIYSPEWDEAAARWLRALSARAIGGIKGGMPASHPADAFEAAWVAHFLLHGGTGLLPAGHPQMTRLLQWLRTCLAPDGASFARSRGLPCDADDTAVVLAILNHSGEQTAPTPLWAFDRGDHFVSYPGERTASTSANAHVLEALLGAQLGDGRTLAEPRDRVIQYLLDERSREGFWLDKWHLGPYYATLSCALALSKVPDLRVRAELGMTSAWLVASQQRNGGWGLTNTTAEETAYALLALCWVRTILPHTGTPAFRQAVQRGGKYLTRQLARVQQARALPTLWVDKSVYVPHRVVRAATLAALHATSFAER
jgi:halimadienyl-diphosphate synthase